MAFNIALRICLHDPITWQGIYYTGTQITQGDFQNKGKSGWTATSSYVLEVPLRNLRPSVIYSVPCDRIVQRAHLILDTGSCFIGGSSGTFENQQTIQFKRHPTASILTIALSLWICQFIATLFLPPFLDICEGRFVFLFPNAKGYLDTVGITFSLWRCRLRPGRLAVFVQFNGVKEAVVSFVTE